MTGTEFFVELRRFLPDVPVVLMTGFAERSDGLASRLSLLPKPFDQAALAKAIARHLRAESAAGGGCATVPGPLVQGAAGAAWSGRPASSSGLRIDFAAFTGAPDFAGAQSPSPSEDVG